MFDLSFRLSVIAALVPFGARVCDIGTDHGYLPVFLAKNSKVKSVIATDVKEKPLLNAKKNIEKSGAKGIELRLCDGLSGINKDEVDTVVIAGMGGEVIAKILSGCQWLKTKPCPNLILQPTTSAEFLRRWLVENNFQIKTEQAVLENGKLYSVMSVVYTDKEYKVNQVFYYVGKIDPKTYEGKLYIEKQQKRFSKCALALENIPSKQTDYLYNKKLSQELLLLIKTED